MIQATKKTKEKTYKAIRHNSSLKNVEHAGTWLYRSLKKLKIEMEDDLVFL